MLILLSNLNIYHIYFPCYPLAFACHGTVYYEITTVHGVERRREMRQRRSLGLGILIAFGRMGVELLLVTYIVKSSRRKRLVMILPSVPLHDAISDLLSAFQPRPQPSQIHILRIDLVHPISILILTHLSSSSPAAHTSSTSSITIAPLCHQCIIFSTKDKLMIKSCHTDFQANTRKRLCWMLHAFSAKVVMKHWVTFLRIRSLGHWNEVANHL